MPRSKWVLQNDEGAPLEVLHQALRHDVSHHRVGVSGASCRCRGAKARDSTMSSCMDASLREQKETVNRSLAESEALGVHQLASLNRTSMLH